MESKLKGKPLRGVKRGRKTDASRLFGASNGRKEHKLSDKTKFPVYMSKETERRLEQHNSADGSTSKTAFVENAINFYIDYLMMENVGAYLPKTLLSVIDGRLGLFENRIASLMYKQTVQTDMAMNIVASSFNLDEDYMHRQRVRSIANVKQTNGQLSFENIARRGSDE